MTKFKIFLGHWLRVPVVMAVTAFLSRIAFAVHVMLHLDQFFGPRSWFGWEEGRVAYSIATGHGFQSPFPEGPTGPTALVPPVYSYVAAAVFRLFGSYSTLSIFLLLALNCLLAAATCILIYRVSQDTLGRQVAIWASWLWALSPLAIFPVRYPWDTCLSALLLILVFYLVLRFEGTQDSRDWIGLGALWGVLALTNPALLAFLPFAMGWLLYRMRPSSVRQVKPAVASALMFLAVVTPWSVRNNVTFRQLFFVRDNFGLELWLGNGPAATGLAQLQDHPYYNTQEFEEYRRMGELAYVGRKGQEAFSFIRNNRAWFLDLTARKVVLFWIGGSPSLSREATGAVDAILALVGLWLVVRRRKRGWFLFASVLAVYPIVYYIVVPSLRYRHPLEPLMAILVAFCGVEIYGLIRHKAGTASMNSQ
jgi:hypothetical protein